MMKDFFNLDGEVGLIDVEFYLKNQLMKQRSDL